MSEEDGYDDTQYDPQSEPLTPEEVAQVEAAQRLEQAIGLEPKPGDFTDYDEYVKSITDHRIKKERYEYQQRVIRDNPNADAGIVMAEAVRQGLEADRAAQAQAQAQARQDIGRFLMIRIEPNVPSWSVCRCNSGNWLSKKKRGETSMIR